MPPDRPLPPIDLQLPGCGVARAVRDGVVAEVVSHTSQTGSGLAWSLARFRTDGPDTVEFESGRAAGYVFTQVPLSGGFESELACGAVYDADTAGLVRPQRSAARFRFSKTDNELFGVLAPLELIEGWFGDEVPDGVRPLLRDRRQSCHLPQHLPGYLRQMLRAALQSRSPMRRQMAEAAAVQILGYQLDRLGPDQPEGPTPREQHLAAEARALLQAAPSDPPTLADLSATLGISARRLDRAYRSAFGRSVYQATQELRFDSICTALLAGEPIKQVAHRFGYTSVSNFSSAFRSRSGLPPRAWLDQQASRPGTWRSARPT